MSEDDGGFGQGGGEDTIVGEARHRIRDNDDHVAVGAKVVDDRGPDVLVDDELQLADLTGNMNAGLSESAAN
jgi:hypothetical protein